MKTKLIIINALFTSSLLFAQAITLPKEITTVKGKHYTDVVLKQVDPDGVRIIHSAGLAKIPFQELPEALRAQFPVNAEQAAAFKAKQEEEARTAAAKIAEDRVKMAEQGNKIAGQTQTDLAKRRAEQPQAVRLTAVNSGGRSETPVWVTDYGSYDKVGTTGRTLYLTASTLARDQVAGKLEVLWLLKDEGSNKPVMMYGGKKPVSCIQGTDAHFIASMELDDRDTKYAALGLQDKSGLRYKGWVARFTDAKGRVTGTAASLPELVKYAGEPWPSKDAK